MGFVQVFPTTVDFEGEHAGRLAEVIGVVEGYAEVVRHCGGLVSPDVFGEVVVGGLPLSETVMFEHDDFAVDVGEGLTAS